MDKPKEIKLRIGDLLRERGMNITEFARVTGLAYNTASSLARGNTVRVDLTTMEYICRALQVEPAQLFEYK